MLFSVKRSGLVVTVASEEEDTAADLVGGVRQPVLRWRRRRGERALALSLLFLADPRLHRGIEIELFKLYRDDSDIGRTFDHLPEVLVTLCDIEGTAYREYVMDVEGLVAGQFREAT